VLQFVGYKINVKFFFAEYYQAEAVLSNNLFQPQRNGVVLAKFLLVFFLFSGGAIRKD
jgi:hypothetical protein